MYPRLNFLLVVFFLGGCSSLFSQEDGFINGKVLDTQNKEPVVFATIRIKGKAVGVISNQDGGFRIPMRFSPLGDTLVISSMGYQKKEVPIKKLQSDRVNRIELYPRIMNLEEAVVTARKKKRWSARKIVEKALEEILRNYPQDSYSIVGYYRDYQIKDSAYINLNEAILEVFDQGFDQEDYQTTEVRMLHYLENPEFEKDTLSRLKYDYDTHKKVVKNAILDDFGGNEFSILRIHDAIRNFKVDTYDFVGTLEADFLMNHSFSRDKDTELDGEEIYVVKCSAKRTGFRAQATLYISKWDFSIHKMVYAMYDTTNKNTVLESKGSGRRKVPTYEITVEYKRQYGKMYLNYISLHNTFRVAFPPKFKVTEVEVLVQEGAFKVGFNNPLKAVSYAEDQENYDFRYQNKKLKFREIKIPNDTTVLLYPDMSPKDLSAMMNRFNTMEKKRLAAESVLQVEVNGILDKDGNLLNQWWYKDYDQFREFFVQMVKPDSRAPFDDRFMDKRKPIFLEQPLVLAKGFEEYWMNTPLRKKN